MAVPGIALYGTSIQHHDPPATVQRSLAQLARLQKARMCCGGTHHVAQTRRLVMHCGAGASSKVLLPSPTGDAAYAYRVALDGLRAMVPNVFDLHFRDAVALEAGARPATCPVTRMQVRRIELGLSERQREAVLRDTGFSPKLFDPRFVHRPAHLTAKLVRRHHVRCASHSEQEPATGRCAACERPSALQPCRVRPPHVYACAHWLQSCMLGHCASCMHPQAAVVPEHLDTEARARCMHRRVPHTAGQDRVPSLRRRHAARAGGAGPAARRQATRATRS